MKTCFSQDVFDVLRDLRLNNNRDWYSENKERINAARKELEDFTNQLIPEVRKFDSNIGMYEAKKTMYKQHRDIRFTKDKSPFKLHFASVLCYGNLKQNGVPCYYIHIEEGHCMLAGGVYCPEKDNLKRIRDEIYYNVDEFKSIINSKSYSKYYNGIDSEEKLKMAPKGYPKDWTDIDLLRNKHFNCSHFCSIEQMEDKDFLNYVIDVFKATAELNKFLFRAIN
ncbi:MAG: DUF2461 domain-containing protein [Bacteroidales bacterium]|jgi:uncharacterized protein (TIGR02453 family)